MESRGCLYLTQMLHMCGASEIASGQHFLSVCRSGLFDVETQAHR